MISRHSACILYGDVFYLHGSFALRGLTVE